MKLVCTCGIGNYLYEWPASDVEHNSVKMKERHVSCACGRGLIVRSALKDEPDSDNEKSAGKISFEELSRRLGVNNKPIDEDLHKHERNKMRSERIMTVTLEDKQAELLARMLVHYGNVFKPAPNNPMIPDQYSEERQKLNALSQKVIDMQTGENVGYSIAEADMLLMATTDRNISKMYPVDEEDDEDPNLEAFKACKDLRKILDAKYSEVYDA